MSKLQSFVTSKQLRLNCYKSFFVSTRLVHTTFIYHHFSDKDRQELVSDGKSAEKLRRLEPSHAIAQRINDEAQKSLSATNNPLYIAF